MNTLVSLTKRRLRSDSKLYYFLRYNRNKLYRLVSGRDYSVRIKDILVNIDLARKYELKNLPQSSLIEITNACNLNCVMCNTKMAGRKIGFMSEQLFEDILKKLSVTGIRSVGLHTVGEPFMYKNLHGLLSIANGYGFNVCLSTNGQFPERIKNLFNEYPGRNYLYRFSIDGATPQMYESIRRGGSFARLLESLEVLQGINQGKIGYKINIAINSTLSMVNFEQTPLFFKVFGKYCWPENFKFTLINSLSPDQGFFRKEFPFPHLIRHNVPCYMPFENIFFTYDGLATLCCRDYEAELVIGDVRDKSISELWAGKEAEALRKKHHGLAKMDIGQCQRCFVPFDFVEDILDEYIHFLAACESELVADEFLAKILSLLNVMNSSLGENNLDSFRDSVIGAFESRKR